MPSIPKLLLQGLKSVAGTIGLKPSTLLHSTPTARTVNAIGAGRNPTVTSYPCQALISVLTVGVVPGTIVQQDDRRIGILGASLPSGVIPAMTDRVTIVDVDGVSKTFILIAPITGDGVGAYFDFVARK